MAEDKRTPQERLIEAIKKSMVLIDTGKDYKATARVSYELYDELLDWINSQSEEAQG